MNDIATRNDVSQVEGSLSEEIIRLKRGQDQLQMEIDESNDRAKKLSLASNTHSQALDGQIHRLEERIENIQNTISRIESHVSDLQESERQQINKISQEEAARRAKDIARLEAQLNVVLEEVTKENQKILSELNQLRSSRQKSKSIGPSEAGYHVIQPGESLSQIASAYGMSVRDLAEANGISNPNSIRVGQKLKVSER